jgi:hypothetical protein
MKPYIRIAVAAFILLLLLAGTAIVVDEPIDPGLQAPMNRQKRQVSPESNLYLALLGFGHGAGQHPHVAGQRIREYLAARPDPDAKVFEDIDNLVPPIKIAHEKEFREADETLSFVCLPEGNQGLDCLSVLKDTDVKYPQLLNDNRPLLERYRQLRRYEDYGHVLIQNYSISTGVRTARNTHWLLLIDVMRAYTRGNTVRAVHELAADIRFLRNGLVHAESLFDKSSLAVWLRRDLVLLRSLVSAGGSKFKPFSAELMQAVLPLSREEISVSTLMPVEMAGYQVFIQTAKRQLWKGQDPYYSEVTKALGEAGLFPEPGWRLTLLSLFLKPNATLNASYRLRMAGLSEAEAQAAATSKEASRATLGAAFIDLLNVAGHRLLTQEAPFSFYRESLDDVNRFTHLLALQVGALQADGPLDIGKITGPDVEWHEARWSLYFEPRSEIWKYKLARTNREGGKRIFVQLPSNVPIVADSIFGLTAECPDRGRCILRSKVGKVIPIKVGRMLGQMTASNEEDRAWSTIFPKVTAIVPGRYIELGFLLATPGFDYKEFTARIRTKS